MSCPVNIPQWQAENRVALYPGKVNRWVLARTLSDRPSDTELHKTLVAVMGRWFKNVGLEIFADRAGDNQVDSIVIEKVSYDRPILPSPAQRKEQLSSIPLMAPGPVVYLTVDFNYRGAITSMPWPVWTAKFSFLTESKLCPVDCDWMLVEAAKQDSEIPSSTLPTASGRQTYWDDFVRANRDAVPLVGQLDTAITLAKWAAVGIGIYLVVSTLQTASIAKTASRFALSRKQAS